MKPDRRIFEFEHGRVYEAPIGMVRECFLVEPSGPLTIGRLEQNLRRDHGSRHRWEHGTWAVIYRLLAPRWEIH
jgi:hypothetical protein